MRTSTTRLLVLMVIPPCLVLIASLIYMLGMAHLEEEPRDFWSSLEFAAETLTSTGYGKDNSWRHPLMIVFVITLQFLGVGLIYLIVPVYLVPFLEERFEARLPRSVGISDHVVIYRHSPAVEILLEELRARDIPLVVGERDPTIARQLVDEGIPVVVGRTPASVLEGVCWRRARALIANGPDDENAAFILAARQFGYSGDILALVEEPHHRRPMTLAGATAALTPKHILATALAAHASRRISPRISGFQHIGQHLQVADFRIDPESELVGRTLGETDLGARTGTTVVGQWVRGRLLAQPAADTRLESSGVLVAVGTAQGLEHLATLAGGSRSGSRGPFLVCGYGEVGRKVVELLREVGEEVKILDLQPLPEVDVVGSALDAEVLEKAGAMTARAVILALDQDSPTLFTTVILNDLAHKVPVIARVNEIDNVERMHRAGADFAVSVSQVSGQMLAARLLGQEEIEITSQLKVMRVSAQGFVGRKAADLDLRRRTGCSFVAVERGGEVLVQIRPDFVFEADDQVYICGSHRATKQFSAVIERREQS